MTHYVLLHGWGFDANIWAELIACLPGHGKAHALNLPGFGGSPCPDHLTLDTMVDAVAAQAPPQAAYIGWSLGGLVAMAMAIRHPDRVQSLTTIGANPKFVADADWPGMPADRLAAFAQQLTTDHAGTLKQFIALQCLGHPASRTVQRRLQAHYGNPNRSPSPKALQDALRILQDSDLRADLKDIQCPSHALFGRCDTLVPPAVASAMQALMPRCQTTVLEHHAHAPFLIEPERIVSLLAPTE